MLRITKRVEYALVVLQQMQLDPDRLVSARDLSERFDLPGGLIAKILQRLASAGLLESEQGVRGGYRLARDPRTITLLELSEAVDGPLRIAACEGDSPGACERAEMCTVSGPVHSLRSRLESLLDHTTIGSLLGADAPVTQAEGAAQ